MQTCRKCWKICLEPDSNLRPGTLSTSPPYQEWPEVNASNCVVIQVTTCCKSESRACCKSESRVVKVNHVLQKNFFANMRQQWEVLKVQKIKVT